MRSRLHVFTRSRHHRWAPRPPWALPHGPRHSMYLLAMTAATEPLYSMVKQGNCVFHTKLTSLVHWYLLSSPARPPDERVAFSLTSNQEEHHANKKDPPLLVPYRTELMVIA
jgi:hypothetical protein